MINIFKKSKQPENLEELIKEWERIGARLEALEQKLERLILESEGFVQRTGLVKYDAFAQTGGRQSFSLALLDKENNGFVLTGLFKEGETRVFIKNITEGRCEKPLSSEEKEAIQKAQD